MTDCCHISCDKLVQTHGVSGKMSGLTAWQTGSFTVINGTIDRKKQREK
ncbi:MAG: hypothetical protein J5986_12265 [Roseburia sp.]|nr:hypothetical protein [Roseburia sp.]